MAVLAVRAGDQHRAFVVALFRDPVARAGAARATGKRQLVSGSLEIGKWAGGVCGSGCGCR